MSEQPVPPGPPLPDPSPRVRVLLSMLAQHDAEQRVTDAQSAVDGSRAAVDDAETRVSAAQGVVSTAEGQLSVAKNEFASFGAWAYMFGGGGVVAANLRGDLTATERQKQFLATSIEYQDEVVKVAQSRVRSARATLAEAEQGEADANSRVQAATEALNAAQDELASAGRERTDATRAERTGRNDSQLTIEGQSVFTGEELAGWFEAMNRHSQATVPIEELAQYFVDEGNAEGIRGDVAFAQSIHETGSFGNPDTISRNNFAGIGHCGDCEGGFIFDSAQMGVRGQMQLLRSYTNPSVPHAFPLVDRRLVGPAGCCQTWNQLAGVWAGDTNYGPRILTIYQQMLEWLVQRRTGEVVVG